MMLSQPALSIRNPEPLLKNIMWSSWHNTTASSMGMDPRSCLHCELVYDKHIQREVIRCIEGVCFPDV
jgi:hypothetical protein